MTVKDYKDMKEKELNNGRLASKLLVRGTPVSRREFYPARCRHFNFVALFHQALHVQCSDCSL